MTLLILSEENNAASNTSLAHGRGESVGVSIKCSNKIPNGIADVKRHDTNDAMIPKQINRAKKGKRKEVLAQHELEADGLKVLFRSHTIRLGNSGFFKGLDFADLFDLVAVDDLGAWWFISVKHRHKGDTYPEHREAINDFAKKYGWPNAIFMLWIWNEPHWKGRGKNKNWDVGGWRKIDCNGVVNKPDTENEVIL